MKAIDHSLSNGTNPGLPQQSNQGNSLKKPVEPEKPHSYNEVEAYNDPESDSFKYRMTKEKFRDDMINYYGKVDQYRAQQQQQAAIRQREATAESDARSDALHQITPSPPLHQTLHQTPQGTAVPRVASNVASISAPHAASDCIRLHQSPQHILNTMF